MLTKMDRKTIEGGFVMATNIYYDKDADLKLVADKTIAIIGYGNQGRAQALNMRDSGCKHIIVGSREDSSYEQAKSDGFEVFSIAEACKKADIIFILLPDEFAPEIFKEQIAPGLKKGDIINFASAYNITFHKITPPEFVDIVMAAPRMIGDGVRQLYLRGQGSPAFVGVAQDASGKALEYGKALCKAIGATKKGAIEVKFIDETMLDLMTEQGIWPIIYHVFVEAFKLHVAEGHPEEAVLMEAYMSREPMYMMEKAAEMGMFKQLPFHSHTSQYGQLTNYEKFDPTQIRKFLKEKYDNIKNGNFAEEWEKEQREKELATLKSLSDKALNCELTKAEERTLKKLK